MNKRFLLLLILVGVLLLPALATAEVGASDPSRLSVGARPLGMGRMFIPVANDASAVFMNPAGMPQAKELQFMTMGSQVVWAVDYQTIGFVLPVGKWGALGLGYAGRNVPDIALFSASASINNRVDRRAADYGSFSDSALLLSWARRFDLFGLKRVGLGGSFKFFQKNGTGSSALDDANATGTNLDLGVHWNWKDDINFAFTGQNVLRPSDKSGTGVLIWDTGEREYFDSIYKVGVSNRFFERRVLAGIEYEKNGSQPNYPGIGHIGVEWHPINSLYVRGGIDQAFAMPDVDANSRYDMHNNVTLGLGLLVSGWRFDYAYHLLNDIPNLTTHFISISLVGDDELAPMEPPEVEVAVTSDILEVFTPEDKTITHSSSILISGRVRDRQNVRINGEDFPVDEEGGFATIGQLGIGRNDVIVSVEKYPVKILRRVLRLASFVDVTKQPYKDPIEYLATLGFVGEDYDGFFKPDRYVTRQEAASMLVKMRNISLPVTMRGIWEDIDLAASQGLIVGFPDGLFRPAEKLTRAQLAVILARFENLPLPSKTTLPLAQRYLAQEHWAAGAVQALVNTGLYNSEEFSPLSGPVTKQELVMAFYKTSYVQRRVNNMLNFIDEPITPTIPKRANLFMRISQPVDSDEKQIFEQIMTGKKVVVEETVVESVGKLTPEAPASDIDIYQMIVAKKAITDVAKGSVKAPLMTLIKPIDKTITYKNIVVAQGSVKNASKLLIDNQSIYLKPGGKFYKKIKLSKFGKRKIEFKATNKSGGTLRKTVRVLYLPTVNDIVEGSYKKTVSGLVALGYLKLDSKNNYDPAKDMTRGEWASLLFKAKGLAPVVLKYKDVPATYPYAKRVGAVAKAGYLPPVSPTLYKPNDPLSRARAGISLAKLEGLKVEQYAGKTGFSDVSVKQDYAKYLAAAKAAGILKGETYKPMNNLTKLSAAQLIAGTSKTRQKLADLYDWNKGY
ncbi:S-layer homology domain-containing protein [Candidatus Margulisiibacteriota bacterium]